VLSAKLREVVGVTEDALFAGLGEKFQIWHPDMFAAHKVEVMRRCREEAGRDPFSRLDQLRPVRGGVQ
jgi:DNA-binding transcriptional regulator/RsmH inhibitor MraZ